MEEYFNGYKIREDKYLGYRYVLIEGKKFYLHRLIMEKFLDRKLTKDEVIHHIDGKKENNDIENLIVLSGSEHRIIEILSKGQKLRENFFCLSCGKELYWETETSLCENCSHISKRKFNPSRDELEKLVWELPMTKVGILYGVSDKSVKKRCIIFGIKLPPHGYWLK